MLRRHFLAATGAGLAVPSASRAQSAWPERPIRLVVPWPPGGTVDFIARIVQPKLSEALGKPVVIENRGGASGSIGASEAARVAPDGTTWLLVWDTEATNQTVMRLPYKVLQAFAPTTLVATGPLVMVAHHTASWRSFQDVVAAAKKAPDTISYGTGGVGSLPHVSTVLLQQLGDFKVTHVPYRGGGPAVQALLSGELPLLVTPIPTVLQHIKAGTARAIAVTSEGESRHLPGVRSYAQQGFPGFEAPTWWALFGRAGTPEPIVRRMHEAMSGVLDQPDVRERIENGIDVLAGGPERCRRFVNSEVEKWGRVIRDNNISLDS